MQVYRHTYALQAKKKWKNYASAARSTTKDFDQNLALQATRDTSIARVTGCLYTLMKDTGRRLPRYPISNSYNIHSLIPTILSPYRECGAKRVNNVKVWGGPQ